LCAKARFCLAKGDVWNRVMKPDDDSAALARLQVGRCPSGRLATWRTDPSGQLEPDGEPDFQPSIGLIEDPGMGVSGPIWVRAGIPVFSADGIRYETRNRRTLCRCGASRNKPFCDGSHIRVRFTGQSVRCDRHRPVAFAAESRARLRCHRGRDVGAPRIRVRRRHLRAQPRSVGTSLEWSARVVPGR